MKLNILVGIVLVTAGLVGSGYSYLPGLQGSVPPSVDASPTAASTPAGPAARVLDAAAAFRSTDAEGDATDEGAASWSNAIACGLGVSCEEPVPAAGTPTPHYDIVAFAYEGETADDLLLTLTLKRLTEGFPELRDVPGMNRMSWFSVCWAAAETRGCDRTASLDVMVHGDAVHTEAKLQIRSDDCNEWWWCAYGIDATVAYGEPATITFTVPKAYALGDGADTGIHNLEAETGWIRTPQAFPAWHPGVTVHTPAYHFHTHGGSTGGFAVTDTTTPAPGSAVFRGPVKAPVADTGRVLLQAAPGANHGAGGPYDVIEMDLLGFDLYEDGADLVAAFHVASFEAQPSYDFDYSVAVGIEGLVYEIGYRQEGGRVYGYSGRCIMEGCQDGVVMDPVVDVEHGTPATIRVRTPLAFLGDPEPGTRTNLFWAMTMYSDVNYYWGQHTDDYYGDYHSVFMVDSVVGGVPFEFGSGRLPGEVVAMDGTHHGHP